METGMPLMNERPDRPLVAELAILHAESLPDARSTRLGLGFLRFYYRFVCSSPLEHVWTAKDREGHPLSVGVVSDSPETLSRRMLLARCRLGGIGRQAEPLFPELVQLFTRAECRGGGQGALLLREMQEWAIGTGKSGLLTRTRMDRENPALRFYHRLGFENQGVHARGKRVYQVLCWRTGAAG